MNKKVFYFFFGILLIIFLAYSTSPAGSDSDTNSTNAWLMFHRTLNHTSWDGTDFSVISGLNRAYYTAQFTESSPAIWNGYVYVASYNRQLYQLNASNVSQVIANFTMDNYGTGTPAVANGYVYIGSYDKQIYQLNASNVSQKINNYTSDIRVYSSPAIWNGYVYFAGTVAGTTNSQIYQLNATNVSQKIANYSRISEQSYSSPAVANGFVYYAVGDQLYQLNATNVSKKIANFTIGLGAFGQESPTVFGGYVYIGGIAGRVWQLNATNVSKMIANYTSGGCFWDEYGDASDSIFISSPAIANGNLYIGTQCGILLQLNATNVSNRIAYSYLGGKVGYTYYTIYSSPLVANGFVYYGMSANPGIIMQLNATNVSKYVANFTNATADYQYASPSYANGYVYFAGSNGIFQLNASNIALENVGISSCTYSGSGNWDITCSDNCTWETNTTIQGNISMIGNGTLTLNKHFIFPGTGKYIFMNRGCQLNINSGGGFS